jgi:hypothetical protein
MVRALVLVVLITAVAAQFVSAQSQATPRVVRIQMPNVTVKDMLHLYEAITHRKVWLELHLDFDRRVSIDAPHEMPIPEAVDLIRRTFREQGIEIREVGDSEAFVSAMKPRQPSNQPMQPTASPRTASLSDG